MAAILAIGFAAIMSIVAPKVDKAKEQISMALFSFFYALTLIMIYLSNTMVLATSSTFQKFSLQPCLAYLC